MDETNKRYEIQPKRLAVVEYGRRTQQTSWSTCLRLRKLLLMLGFVRCFHFNDDNGGNGNISSATGCTWILLLIYCLPDCQSNKATPRWRCCTGIFASFGKAPTTKQWFLDRVCHNLWRGQSEIIWRLYENSHVYTKSTWTIQGAVGYVVWVLILDRFKRFKK